MNHRDDVGRTEPRVRHSGRRLVGLVIVVFVALTAILAPRVAPYDPLDQRLLDRRQPPSWEHPLGLDELGRDNLSRLLHGARLSLRVGITAVATAAAVGTLMGTAAGYWGGLVDAVIVGFLDVMLAFPTLLLAICVIFVMGRGLTNVVYAVALAQVPVYARLVRVNVLLVKERDHVLAARALGATLPRVLARHIVPGCMGPLVAQATLGIGSAILEMAGLSFLGLGVQPPAPEWGAMIAQGRGAVFTAPHVVVFPGLALMVTVLGFNLLGDGLQDGRVPR
jgi:peptide/nickel transport system permease protein